MPRSRLAERRTAAPRARPPSTGPPAPNPILGALVASVEEDADAVLFTFVDDGSPGTWPRMSRGDVLEQSLRVADALRQRGLEAGDRLVMLCHNEPSFLPLWLGCLAGGIIPVPLNTALHGASLSKLVARVGPRAAFASQDLYPAIEGLVPTAFRTEREELRSFLAGAQAEVASIVETAPGALATIMCTSGTTGTSKGVMWTHEFLVGMTTSARAVMGHGKSDVAFTPLPLFHSQALAVTSMTAIVTGSEAVIATRFSASQFWRQAAQSEATLTYMVGSIPQILWAHDPSPWERRHRIRLAQVIPPPAGHYQDFEQRFGLKITELYGMTDIGIPIGIPHGESRPGLCGKVLPDWECDVVDDGDVPLPDGAIGELVVRPRRPWIMPLGYWDDPLATMTSWRNLWFHTGDFVRRDTDGWFQFVDRKRDAIRRAGENISSLEVEEVLKSHPSVHDAAVFGVSSELGEEEVMAAVVSRPGSRVEAADLVAHCERDLPYFAVPRFYDFVGELPRTENEKIRKQVLREKGVTATTIDTGSRSRTALDQRVRARTRGAR